MASSTDVPASCQDWLNRITQDFQDRGISFPVRSCWDIYWKEPRPRPRPCDYYKPWRIGGVLDPVDYPTTIDSMVRGMKEMGITHVSGLTVITGTRGGRIDDLRVQYYTCLQFHRRSGSEVTVADMCSRHLSYTDSTAGE